MTGPKILAGTLAAAYLYVISPGPAFLALFTLAASRGRAAGAFFICGHLAGDVTWGALAVAANVGDNRIGPTCSSCSASAAASISATWASARS